ncbi:MAG TPA: MoxR family ATPase [Nitrolancea sp.]|nr:MoxR family ATPase [Nitrolancea sp.]
MRESDVTELGQRIIDNVDRVIVGKRGVTEFVLVALLCEGHVLVEDVPGVGKTTLARAVARSIGGQFRRIQFTPDLLPSDISGIVFFNQKTGDFELRPGPVFGNILLADEINRATPRTQAALLEAMEERTVTIEGETMPLPRPFLVLATENPVELEGTFPLPEAQLDRFFLRIELGYPEPEDELKLLARFQTSNPLDELGPVTSPEELLEAVTACRKIYVDEELRQYIIEIGRATRAHDTLRLGVSPRGTLALFRAAQALAAIRGRAYVVPDDVKLLSSAVLSHRIMLSPEARLRGRRAGQIIEGIVSEVSVPVEHV